LGTDGLWDVVDNQEAVDMIRKGGFDKAAAADMLVNRALKLGSNDNI